MRVNSSYGHPRAGFTLTEIAIVLGVIGIILGAIWVAASTVFSNNKANQAAQDIMTIANNVRQTYTAANQFGATGDQTAAMITAGVMPSDLISPPGAASPAIDAWSGAVKIFTNPTGGNARVFRISFYNTPADACVRIASQLANLGTGDAPINLITACGGSSTAIPNAGATVGLSTQTVYNVCQLNIAGACQSTEFDFNIH